MSRKSESMLAIIQKRNQFMYNIIKQRRSIDQMQGKTLLKEQGDLTKEIDGGGAAHAVSVGVGHDMGKPARVQSMVGKQPKGFCVQANDFVREVIGDFNLLMSLISYFQHYITNKNY